MLAFLSLLPLFLRLDSLFTAPMNSERAHEECDFGLAGSSLFELLRQQIFQQVHGGHVAKAPRSVDRFAEMMEHVVVSFLLEFPPGAVLVSARQCGGRPRAEMVNDIYVCSNPDWPLTGR